MQHYGSIYELEKKLVDKLEQCYWKSEMFSLFLKMAGGFLILRPSNKYLNSNFICFKRNK